MPGMADELLRELASLLAEEGIDVSNIDVPDLNTLQQALGHAVDRHNMAMFTPVGHARDLAAAIMRHATGAITGGAAALAASVLDQARPNHPTARPRPAVSGSPSACWTSGCPGTTPAPRQPGRADPVARRALDRGTRRSRHPHPRPQGTRICLPRRANRPARRPARPLGQRPHPRHGSPSLGATRRHPAHRARPHCRPLKPLPSQPSVASVARTAAARKRPPTSGAKRGVPVLITSQLHRHQAHNQENPERAGALVAKPAR